MRKKVFTGVIALTMTLTFNTNVLADPVSDRVNEQQNIINQNRDPFNKAKKVTDSIQGNIEMLDDQIIKVNSEINENKVKIANTEKSIKVAQQSIKDSEEKLAKEQKLYNERMRAMYIHGNDGGNGYINVLIESNGIRDFLSRVEVVKRVDKLNKKTTTELNNQRVEIEKKKVALEKENAKMVATLDENTKKLSKLNQDKQTQNALIAQAKQEENKYASKIAAANGQIDSIRASVPKMNPSRGAAAISSNSIVAYATNFIGVPYVYGANGPSSFDCSGFTKYVMGHFGVNLNRVAADQASQGSTVSRDQLQPGDLVFFGSRGISHVGIYVGNECYIHAPHSGSTVQISPLNRSDFACARRVY